MSTRFSANEIFEMAGQMELNGARFYRKAAEMTEDPDHRQLLQELAGQEDEHKRVFAQMQKKLSEAQRLSTAFDPDDESVLYLRAFMEGVVFDLQQDPCQDLAGMETLDATLATAIGMEKDSIAFYLGLKELVPPALGKAKIEQIIQEEMEHVAILGRKRAQLRA